MLRVWRAGFGLSESACGKSRGGNDPQAVSTDCRVQFLSESVNASLYSGLTQPTGTGRCELWFAFSTT